jgi:integrase
MKTTDIVPGAGKREDVIFGKRLKQIGLFNSNENIPSGFGLRVRPGSDGIIRSWIMQYRVHGRMTRLKIADAHNVTPTQALNQARKVRGQIDLGGDPQGDKKDRRDKATMTFKSVVDDFLAVKTGSKNTLRALRVYLNTHAKPLHGTPIDQITRKDISARLLAVSRSSGAPTASCMRGAISTFFAWAVQMDFVESNPVIGSYKPPTGKARDRVLSDTELAAIWNNLDDDDYGKIVKLLICTACRREEIGNIPWSEFNDDFTEWTLPKERAKNGKANTLPITPLMAEIINSVPRRVGVDCLFGPRGAGFTRWVDGRNALKDKITLKPFWLHDIRRSVATGMAEHKDCKYCENAVGVMPHVIETILNHASGHKRGHAGTYNRAAYKEEVREAMALWNDHVTALIPGGKRKIAVFDPVVHKSA